MFGVVAPYDDKLTLAVEIKNIHDIQAFSATAASRRTNSASKEQTENIQHEHRSDEERDERSERWQQLSEFIGHKRLFSRSDAGDLAKLTAFLASAEKRLMNG
jgi:hypothetical protein